MCHYEQNCLFRDSFIWAKHYPLILKNTNKWNNTNPLKSQITRLEATLEIHLFPPLLYRESVPDDMFNLNPD